MKVKDILDNYTSQRGVISIYNEEEDRTVTAWHREKLNPLLEYDVVDSYCQGGNLYIQVPDDVHLEI